MRSLFGYIGRRKRSGNNHLLKGARKLLTVDTAKCVDAIFLNSIRAFFFKFSAGGRCVADYQAVTFIVAALPNIRKALAVVVRATSESGSTFTSDNISATKRT